MIMVTFVEEMINAGFTQQQSEVLRKHIEKRILEILDIQDTMVTRSDMRELTKNLTEQCG